MELGMTDMSPALAAKLAVLEEAVASYFQAWWEEGDVLLEGDYIASWALVANYSNLEDPSKTGYVVEASPSNMPPHAMKGLFGEGIDWVTEAQDGRYADE